MPTVPPDSVANSRLLRSELMNTSAHGHTPSAPASRDVYRNVSQRLRSNRSSLTRMVVTLLYSTVCNTCRGSGMQYCNVMPRCAAAAAMLPMNC